MRKNNFLYFILITCFFESCGFDPEYTTENRVLDWENALAPLTKKEIEFEDSLSKLDFETKIARTFAGRHGDGKSTYYIECNNLWVDNSNTDSLEYFRKNVLNTLYTNVIEDSVIFDLHKITVNFNKINYKEGVDKRSFLFSKNYLKDSLVIWNGFTVIKYGNNKFKRVKV